MKRHISGVVTVAVVIVITACNAITGSDSEVVGEKINRCKAVLTSPPTHVPTTKTPDGAVAGNGDLGITLGGSPDSLCIYIGKNDFWRAYPVYPGGIALPGGLNIYIPSLAGATYNVEQLPGTAEIKGCFTKGDTILNMTAWVPATRNLVVVELESDKKMDVDADLWAATGNTSTTTKGLNGVSWVTRSFENTPNLKWDSHIAMASGLVGSKWPESGKITLLPGEKQSIVVSAFTNHDDPEWKDRAIGEAISVTEADIETIRKEHLRNWSDFWSESSVSIGDEELERYYYMSQYLFACSSRSGKFAPGIWGPFITRDEAAWGGDYHLNYNYQAPFWAAYSSNHISLTDNFDKPLLDFMDEGRQCASELLGCRGIYYPVGIGPKGLCTSMWPLTPEEMMEKYSTRENTIDNGYKFLGQKINAVFSAGNMLMRHYSTYDKEYAEKVYPYLVACADFWEDYLKL